MSDSDGETVDITSSSENEAPDKDVPQTEQSQKEPTRKDILSPVIHSTVAALGGVETDSKTNVTRYVLGDDCLGCLRDLKKLWRKDDTDDERTVARVFWETRVLINDLVPILVETAGEGSGAGDKKAVACADVIAAMTWPIDIAQELKELDEQYDEKTDYATLLLAQLHYKEALSRPEVLKALQNIMMPCMAKDRRSRVERDSQIISLVLHIFRNLLALKDPPRTSSSLSSSATSLSSLQSRLLVSLRNTGLLELLITCASNADQPEFSEFSAVLLEISYLLVRGVGVRDVVKVKVKMERNEGDRAGGSGMMGDGEDEELKALLERENREKKMSKRGAPTRHSRFGTTITLKTDKQHYVLHRQEAITADPSQMIDMVKKKRAKKTVKVDEVGVFNPLGSDALSALAGYAGPFIESCFNVFMACVLKDIKAERPKYTDKDNLRLLFLTKWFLEFFLLVREEQEKERKQRALFATNAQEIWPFGYVSEVVEHAWAPWVLRRMRAAVEEKPKQWVELHAGMDCLVQMLNLITLMAQDTDEAVQEAAETLQSQLYYNGEALDVALESLRGYKDQSIAYLDSAVHLAFVLLRMLEKWANSQGEMYVRKRKKKARAKKAQAITEEEGIVDVESDGEDDKAAAEDLIQEQMFVFEKYEAKFAQEDIAHACLVYLARWREFTSPEQMRRIVSLLHRQAVKAKAEGFFFKVSTLALFQSILKVQTSLPKDQPYKDLVQLINFVLRKFFKNAKEHPLLLVEAFYPKNRGQWKAYSSYEPEVKAKSSRPAGKAELAVKRGFKASEQIGIAIACLVEEESKLLIDWVVDVLKRVGRKRQEVVDATDGDGDEDVPSDEDEEAAAAREAAKSKRVPSKDAMDKFENYRIPYVEDHHAEAATSNKYLKLLMRLVGFTCEDDDALELEWHVPASLTPSELQTSQNVIEQYLANPIDLQGKKAKSHLTTKRGPRRRREAELSSSESSALSDSGEDDFLPNDGPSVERRAARRAEREERRAAKRRRREERAESKKRERKKKETVQYKSAETIVDSDAELGDDEAFFARERELMERAKKAGEGNWTASSMMLSHGTKKRTKKESKGKRKGKRSREEAEDEGAEARAAGTEEGEDAGGLSDTSPAPAQPKAKPRPRRKPKVVESDAEDGDAEPEGAANAEGEPAPWAKAKPRPRPRMRVAAESDGEGGEVPEQSVIERIPSDLDD
ncbi:Topoisomerase 1-associated factor 1 [Ceratobasidium sp. 392]|nr:Topoisomerase 1-associated factor 1 [Ceratobasidium sp. 392]